MAIKNPLLKLAAAAIVVPVALTGLSGCAEEKPKSKPGGNSSNESGDKGGSKGGGSGLPFNIGGGAGGSKPTEEPPYGGPTSEPGGSGGAGTDTIKFGTNDLSKIDWDVTCMTRSSQMVTGQEGTSFDPDAGSFYVMIDNDKITSVSISAGKKSGNGDMLYWSETTAAAGEKVEGSYDGKKIQVKGTGSLNFVDPVSFELSVTCDSTL